MDVLVLLFFVNISYSAKINNEARVVQDVFKKYNPRVRPVINHRNASVITVSFALGRLEPLDERNQVFHTFGWMGITWKDELLHWNPADYGGVTEVKMRQSDVWLPELSMRNSIVEATDLSLKSNFRVTVTHRGIITWAPGFKWETSCLFDLTYFPFDEHQCDVIFVSYIYQANVVRFKNNDDHVDLQGLRSTGGWMITNTSVQSYNELIHYEGFSLNMSQIKFTINVKRIPSYIIWNVFIPCILMTFTSLLVFALPFESGEKIGLAITVLLGYTVMLLMVSDTTPQSGENIPMITQYIVASMLMTGCCLCLTVFTLNLHHMSPHRALPAWIHTLVLRGLATLLLMRERDGDHGNGNAVSPEKKYMQAMLNGLKEKGDTQKQVKTGLSIPRHFDNLAVIGIHYLKRKLHEDLMLAREQENQHQWQQVARVLDRLFLVVSAFTIVILGLSFILPMATF